MKAETDKYAAEMKGFAEIIRNNSKVH